MTSLYMEGWGGDAGWETVWSVILVIKTSNPMLMTLGTMVRQPLDPSKVGHWSHGSDGYFPTIIYDHIMRQIYDNISLYLTLVWWNISNGKDSWHHGGCFPTIISDYIMKLKYDNIILYLTLVYIYHVGMLGIEPSITWKCPPTSVLPAAALWSVWRIINSLHNWIKQENTITIVD